MDENSYSLLPKGYSAQNYFICEYDKPSSCGEVAVKNILLTLKWARSIGNIKVDVKLR